MSRVAPAVTLYSSAPLSKDQAGFFFSSFLFSLPSRFSGSDKELAFISPSSYLREKNFVHRFLICRLASVIRISASLCTRPQGRPYHNLSSFFFFWEMTFSSSPTRNDAFATCDVIGRSTSKCTWRLFLIYCHRLLA